MNTRSIVLAATIIVFIGLIGWSVITANYRIDAILFLILLSMLLVIAGVFSWRERQVTIRLQSSEAYYRTLAQNLPEIGVLLFDHDLRALVVEGSIFGTIEMDPHDLEGRLLVETLAQDVQAVFLPLYLQTLAGQRGQVERTSTRGRHYVVDTIPLRTATNLPAGMAVIQDVTDRKQLQLQFLQAQKMEGIGRLAGGIAHDFNNLLTAIMGTAELMLSDLDPISTTYADAQEILTVSRRASALTRQILSFARQQIIQPRHLDINPLLVESFSLLRRLLPESIELSMIPAETPLYTIGDPAQLDQVIMNLAVNARDAMPQGGSLRISATERMLTTPPEPNLPIGPWIVICIEDTGIGMLPEVLERAMEPFFTTKAHGKGTGLGLSMCYGIVHQHGGALHLASVPQQGTSVELFLPVADASPLPHRDDLFSSFVPHDTHITPGSGTIVLVEDDGAVRSFVERTLRLAGYTIVAFGNGIDALDALAHPPADAPPIDLILSDVIMPLMNGPQLAAEIARRYPDIPVILMSGYTDNTITQAGVVDAGVLFLPKPFTAQELTTRIATILHQRKGDASC